MNNLLIYLIKVAVGSAIFFSVFLVFYSKETFYFRNRIILILSIMIPSIIPLLTYTVSVYTPYQPLHETDLQVFTDAVMSDTASGEKEPVFSLLTVISWLYFSGLILLIIRGLISILSTYYIIIKSRVISESFPKVLLSEKDHPPFSFFPYAVMPITVYKNGNYSDILDHESAHLRQGHTFDLLLSELFIAFQWFNPFAWLIKRYMVLNHEYLADHVSVSKRNIKDYQYRLLEIAGATKTIALAHSFNSLIKNRIIMINKKPTNRKAAWKILLILPVVLGLSYAFIEPDYKQVSPDQESLTIMQPPQIIQKEVRGIVMREDGKPLEGVYITFTGTLGDVMFVNSGADGRFKLASVREDAFLLLSHRGYASVTIKPDFRNEMKIIMARDSSFVEAKYINPPANQADNKPLVFLDGVISDKTTAELISGLGNEFGTVRVLKGKEAVDKYGEKGRYGVEEVYSRKKASELGLKFPFRRVSPDEYPTFQGNNFMAFKDWVISNTKYPAEAASTGVHGRVTVSYTIAPDGSVTDVRIQGKADPLLGETVVKTIQSSPGWEPAVKEEGRLPFTHMVSLKFVLPDEIMPDDVYVVTEVMPLYPGGDAELLKYLSDNVKYPGVAKEQRIEGRVILRFIVNVSGDVEEVSVLKGVHPLLDEEAIRVVSTLKGFTPGSQGGVPVNVWYMVPITFKLPDTEVNPAEGLKFRSKDGKVPLIVIDGAITDIDVNTIKPETVESVHVIKDQSAIDKYGEKGREGVIEIILKKPK